MVIRLRPRPCMATSPSPPPFYLERQYLQVGTSFFKLRRKKCVSVCSLYPSFVLDLKDPTRVFLRNRRKKTSLEQKPSTYMMKFEPISALDGTNLQVSATRLLLAKTHRALNPRRSFHQSKVSGDMPSNAERVPSRVWSRVFSH